MLAQPTLSRAWGASWVLLVLAMACKSSTSRDAEVLRRTPPEEQGVDSAVLADLVERIDREDLPIDSLLLARNGAIVLDAYFFPYLGHRPHDVASVTKSVTSTLVGIAIDEGVLSFEDTLGSIFGASEAPNASIGLRSLLSMSSGLDCGLAPGEPELFEMIGTDNWVDYALGIPVSVPPETRFAYCSPGSHLLSAAITERTGLSAEDYAVTRLFSRIGVRDFVWPADPQGNSRGWGDLQLRPLDMAKLGQLFLDRGRWNRSPIVPESWVDEATVSRIEAGSDGTGYGYQWWVLPPPLEGIYEARGRGGHAIVVWPERDVVAVFTGRGADVRDQIAPALLTALQSQVPLGSNPAGVARLEAALKQALAPPEPEPIAPLPPAAALISGRRFRLPDNLFDVRCVRLDFDGADDVTFEVTTSAGAFPMRVGMDAVPRFTDRTPTGIPVGLVGEWTEPRTFLLHYDEVSGSNHLRIENVVGERGSTLAIEFSDPGGYFPTVSLVVSPAERCE